MNWPAPFRASWFWHSLAALVCTGLFALASAVASREIPERSLVYLFIWGTVATAVALLGYTRFRVETCPPGIGYSAAYGVLVWVAQLALFAAYRRGPGDAAVISTLTGLYAMVTVVLAVFLLGERLTVRQLAGLGFAVLAIFGLLFRPAAVHRAASLPAWSGAALGVLMAWGMVGVFQKLAARHMSVESTLIWQTAVLVLFLPLVYPEEPLAAYPPLSLACGLLSGVLSNVGTWFLIAAMKNGGKASVVAPICSLYPLVVVFLAPILLQESITLLQYGGVGCAVVSIVLLSS